MTKRRLQNLKEMVPLCSRVQLFLFSKNTKNSQSVKRVIKPNFSYRWVTSTKIPNGSSLWADAAEKNSSVPFPMMDTYLLCNSYCSITRLSASHCRCSDYIFRFWIEPPSSSVQFATVCLTASLPLCIYGTFYSNLRLHYHLSFPSHPSVLLSHYYYHALCLFIFHSCFSVCTIF